MSAFRVCVQPVSATPLVVYRLAFRSPRCSGVTGEVASYRTDATSEPGNVLVTVLTTALRLIASTRWPNDDRYWLSCA
jgi:hypothetical protein